MTQAVHIFYSTDDAYDACQTDENIKTGDILFIPSEKVIGLAWTWPIAVSRQHGNLHTTKTGSSIEDIDNGLFRDKVFLAREWCLRLEYEYD